jgi:hypothetical protein
MYLCRGSSTSTGFQHIAGVLAIDQGTALVPQVCHTIRDKDSRWPGVRASCRGAARVEYSSVLLQELKRHGCLYQSRGADALGRLPALPGSAKHHDLLPDLIAVLAPVGYQRKCAQTQQPA